jgi:hypothetical protein
MRARLSPRGLVVVMIVVAVMVVVPMSYLYNHLGIGRRIQGKKHTQRTQCEQTSLDVNVHDRLPELVCEMPNRGWQEDLFSSAQYGGVSSARCPHIAVKLRCVGVPGDLGVPCLKGETWAPHFGAAV